MQSEENEVRQIMKSLTNIRNDGTKKNVGIQEKGSGKLETKKALISKWEEKAQASE